MESAQDPETLLFERPASADNGLMALVRIPLELMVAFLFWLVAHIITFQGVAAMGAVGSAMVISRAPDTASWANPPLLLGGLMCLPLLLGGSFLKLVQTRSGLTKLWGEMDDSIRPQWLLPAAIPTLALPVVAFLQSGGLIQLWRDVFAMIDRFGGVEQIVKSDRTGLALIPAAGTLFVPFLEAVAGFFLIALPPMLLVLLWAKSGRFRLESQRLVIAQWSLVGASVLGAMLFGLLVDLATPHILKADAREGAMVLQELTRGRSVLTETATAYSALALAYTLALWVFMAAHRPREANSIVIPETATSDNPTF